MLLNKNYGVSTIKLISGEELIAKVEADDTNVLTLSRPKLVTVGMTGNVGMINWLILGNDENVTVLRSHIISIVSARKEAAEQYLQAVTGIALA